MVVAASSAFAQSHLNNKRERSPLHRTLFNIASLIVTVQGAGLAFRLLAHAGPDNALTALARPLVGAATVYFLLEHGAHCNGHFAVVQRAHHDDVAYQLPVERAELFRRRRHRGARAVADRATPAGG